MKRRSFLALLSATAASKTFAATPLRAVLPTMFSAAPAVRFIAFGDAGTGDNQQAALGRVMAKYQQSQAYDTALLLGDNIYPDGDLANVAAKFERPYADLLNRGVKFHAVLGNHDVRKGREAQVKYPHFNMGGRSYYSFTKGESGVPLVEFFALDTNAFDGAQRRWFETALAASRARWKVAYFHHPIYSSGGNHGSDEKLRGSLEPLLARYGVAAVFSGHDHLYERTKVLQGVQYFVSGAGGKLRHGDLNRRTPFHAFGSDDASSFMSVEVTAERFSFQSIDIDGRVIDSGELTPPVIMRPAMTSQLDPKTLEQFAVKYPANFAPAGR
jgi:3',5'-cyclic AMP phosphodiesterase CpdA